MPPVGHAASSQYFTVRDSIEMQRFGRDTPGPQLSPDKRYFAVVTSGGVFATNTIESTLWIFSGSQVRSFLAGKITRVQPRALIRINTGVSDSFPSSYEPVISSVQWVGDSTGLMFLEGGMGRRRLARVDLASGATHTLSPARYDVTRFAHTTVSSIYRVSWKTPQGQGGRINADAVDVTGMSWDMLFPEEGGPVRNAQRQYERDFRGRWALAAVSRSLRRACPKCGRTHSHRALTG
jgi:hypothetical protein